MPNPLHGGLLAALVLLASILSVATAASAQARTYFTQDRNEVSLTEQQSSSGPYFANLGGPSITVNVPARATVSYRLSFQGQTGTDPDGRRAGVFAAVVDSLDDFLPYGAGRTPSDSNWHTYTYLSPQMQATAGKHTYTLEYEEVPVLGIGGVTGPFPPANFKNRKLWIEVTR